MFNNTIMPSFTAWVIGALSVMLLFKGKDAELITWCAWLFNVAIWMGQLISISRQKVEPVSKGTK
jgi:hypothetical protein